MSIATPRDTSNAITAQNYIGGEWVDGDGSFETSDVQILNAEKGFISFLIDSVAGTLVDSSGNVVITGKADARAFNIGIHSGAFFTKDASDPDNLSPEFTIEVSQA